MTAIVWCRRDLRLADNAALVGAVATGQPVLPVFVFDEICEALGAAAKWRLGRSLADLAAGLEGLGSRLVLRRGSALAVLQGLVAETNATSLHWTRGYEAVGMARDMGVRAAVAGAVSYPGALLWEPWQVSTAAGGVFKVYTAFWHAVRRREVAGLRAAPGRPASPEVWPVSDRLEDWGLDRAVDRGGAVLARLAGVGEAAAQVGLARFVAEKLPRYASERDFPDRDICSGLSENLAWGEISPTRVWATGMAALRDGIPGAEKFLQEVVWREFAWHLLYHTPHLAVKNWRDEWDAFPWRGDNADAERWRRGTTGVDLVDAGMREMYATGRMHNRVRMVVASYLTKHLLTDWRVGAAWFAECLTDWDPASNALGWQWVAGSGPDSAPFFRVFNPDLQAEKFDSDGIYRRYWLQGEGAEAFAAAVPKRWDLSRDGLAPVIALAQGRKRALAAYAGITKTVA